MNVKFKLVVFFSIGTFLLLVLISSVYGGKKDELLPKMYIHKTSVDLGDVYEGVDIKYAFTINNNGLGKLNIKVRPG